MLTRTVIPAEDLLAMMAAVFAYNRRGRVIGLSGFAPDGQPVQIGWVEVFSDEPGLAVRHAPEPDGTPAPAGLDPRAVPAPQTMEELAREP